MTKLVLDILDASVLDELRRRADQHGWSVEEEARHILASAVEHQHPAPADWPSGLRVLREAAAAIRAETAGKVTADVVALLREDRDR